MVSPKRSTSLSENIRHILIHEDMTLRNTAKIILLISGLRDIQLNAFKFTPTVPKYMLYKLIQKVKASILANEQNCSDDVKAS